MLRMLRIFEIEFWNVHVGFWNGSAILVCHSKKKSSFSYWINDPSSQLQHQPHLKVNDIVKYIAFMSALSM